MTGRARAAATACILLLAGASAARAQTVRSATPPSGLMELPAVRARPPASRVTASGQLVHPVLKRPAVEPAVSPATPLDETRVAANGESFAQITPEAMNGGRELFPVGPGLRGPSVLRVQVLLDRALFSPGMIDGSWGKNTSVSVYWFQAANGLTATGIVDSATYEKLMEAAGRPQETVLRHRLTPGEVRGPFIEMPSNIYEQAKLDCSCYESLSEKLTETFHARAELLRRLNPGVRLDSLRAGDSIWVPAIRDGGARPKGTVETLVVNGPDHYLQALDSAGRILYHFPTTLGSSYDPSPEGSFHVLAVTENPWWHYQPAILHHGHENDPDASIPPGPNSAVGRLWMTLDAGHYGIHGTKSPETIGYAVSAGCVRLTNWDALYLGRRVTPGTAVVFRGTRTRTPSRAVDRTPAQPTLPGVRADSLRARPARPDTTRRDTTRRDTTRRDTSRSPAPAPAPTPTRPDSASAKAPASAPARAATAAVPAQPTPTPTKTDSSAKP
jgi:peptidoglycan hydrolase-like protein with peptidoglycan-binding domain